MSVLKCKWGKEVLDVPVDLSEPPEAIHATIFRMTGVPEERQKLMGIATVKGRLPASWAGLTLPKQIMLIGTAVVLATPAPAAPDALPEQPVANPYPAGLRNVGNTCWLNSCLQCLRATPRFSDALFAYNGSAPHAQPPHHAALALRALFEQMSDPAKRDVVPVQFLQLFRSMYPQFAETNSLGMPAQQDAEEGVSQVLTTLSAALPPLRAPEAGAGGAGNAVAQIFGGAYAVRTERDGEAGEAHGETFFAMQCHISPEDKPKFLLDGLRKSLGDTLVKRSPLTGADEKYTRTKRVASLPFVLQVHFVRFFWKAQTSVKAKILWPIDFPWVLDVYDLCTPELQGQLDVRRNALRVRDAALTTQGGGSSEVVKASDMKNETGVYELYAVLTHKGLTADGGHYVAWVKDEKFGWLCYDDDTVYPVKEEEIRKLVGSGGSQWHIAYLAFYRTKND